MHYQSTRFTSPSSKGSKAPEGRNNREVRPPASIPPLEPTSALTGQHSRDTLPLSPPPQTQTQAPQLRHSLADYHRVSVREPRGAQSFADCKLVLNGTSYQVTKRIAGGGSSIVYAAQQVAAGSAPIENMRMPQQLAIKLIRHHKDGVATERLLREGALISNATHPNVVHGFGAGIWHERPFITMNLVDGETVRSALRRDGAFSTSHALQVTIDVLCGLHYLYFDGRISAHRDIKPSNIMLTSSNTAILIDLGSAKSGITIEHDLSTGFLGSAPYQAPEQLVAPELATIQSDFYALGTVFFEMCTGKRLFDATGMQDRKGLITTKRTASAPCLLERAELCDDIQLARACQEILDKTLDPDPANRFRTPAEFLVALHNARRIAGQRPHITRG